MSKATGDEKTAYEKMVQGLRHAQEAATEIAIFQQDPSYMVIANAIGQMTQRVVALAHQSAVERAVTMGNA